MSTIGELGAFLARETAAASAPRSLTPDRAAGASSHPDHQRNSRRPDRGLSGMSIERSTTMRAAVVTGFTAPLEMQDLPVPEPGPGQVLVRIECSGLCHTDIHAARGDWPVKPTPPFVPGHEGVGIVETLGDGVTDAGGRRPGRDRRGSAMPAAQCRYCIGGLGDAVREQQNSGYSVNGAFAEYAVADAAFATPVPDAVSSRDAAPLTCAGVTTYKAIKVARVGSGGAGGGLRCRRARSSRRCSTPASRVGSSSPSTSTDDKLAMATELGADHVVNARDDRPGRGDPGAGRRRRRGRRSPRHRSRSSQAYRVAAARRPAGVRRAARRTTTARDRADLRHGGRREVGDRLDRRHPQRSRRRLRAARRRPHPGDRGRARKLDEVNESIDDVLAGRVPARVVFEL